MELFSLPMNLVSNLMLIYIYFFFPDLVLAVAKALRRAAEGKASAQAESAEWKRKYELERARNLQLEHKGCIDQVTSINRTLIIF